MFSVFYGFLYVESFIELTLIYIPIIHNNCVEEEKIVCRRVKYSFNFLLTISSDMFYMDEFVLNFKMK